MFSNKPREDDSVRKKGEAVKCNIVIPSPVTTERKLLAAKKTHTVPLIDGRPKIKTAKKMAQTNIVQKTKKNNDYE